MFSGVLVYINIISNTSFQFDKRLYTYIYKYIFYVQLN